MKVTLEICSGRRRAPVAGRGVDGKGDHERGRIGSKAVEAGVRLVEAAQHQVRVNGRLRGAAARSALRRRHQGRARGACVRARGRRPPSAAARRRPSARIELLMCRSTNVMRQAVRFFSKHVCSKH